MLTKVNYVDDTTVIHAKNLNDIQDAIIELESSPAGGGVLSVNGKTPDDAGDVDLTAADVGAVAVDQIKVWISPDPTSPASIFGGTWTQIKDRFILAAGDTYAAGSTGGEAAHTLTIPELAAHSGHLYANNLNTGGATGIYLPQEALKSYGSETHGWHIQNGNEAMVAGHSEGGQQPHNNMPPYLSLYIWMRVTEEVAA